MLNTAVFYYFSPTGGTKKAGELLCRGLAAEVIPADLGTREATVNSLAGDVTVFAAPVFGGRIPALMTKKLQQLDGSGKRAVVLVVYGNRAYDDALLELADVVREQGYQVTAAAALVAQHSMVPEVGRGRPDEEDGLQIRSFAKKILAKMADEDASPVAVPGNFPYKKEMDIVATPLSLPACTQCGSCAEACPTQAIRLEEESVVTERAQCILCVACTAACPAQARVLPPPMVEKLTQMLASVRDVRSGNDFFF